MKIVSLLLLCMLASIVGVKAQIGYQISLLNTATGEPRANETVTVSVSLSNNANEVFYSETKSATTNDFGVLSLSIGNADTFKSVDLSKMPFFIEVTANGVSIGKSQILSVPVAEVAKDLVSIDKSEIVGTWSSDYDGEFRVYIFKDDGQYTTYQKGYENDPSNGFYEISGRNIYVHYTQVGSTRTNPYFNVFRLFCNGMLNGYLTKQ